MSQGKKIIYPYIPNSEPSIKAKMLQAVEAQTTDEFYADVPENLRMRTDMNFPEPFLDEYSLRRHVDGLLSKNIPTGEYLSFLGAGCYQHYVPAVCDEINSRGEFLTAYAGEPYDDHGRFQALFEYASMMGELLNMDVVNVPTYDGYQASATSLRMAARLTGRKEVVLCKAISADKLSKIRGYLKPDIDIRIAGYDPQTGQVDLVELTQVVSNRTAAVYFENPSYLGIVECAGDQIAEIARRSGAVCVVSADPCSLGVLTPPVDYGADIVCGDIQGLGIHMNFGGGQAGYIATRDEAIYVMEFPSRLFGIAPTSVEGEYGFGDVAYARTSFAVREEGNEWVGTAAALWGITAGVYLALMGPQGMRELGEGIMARAHYAMQKMDAIPGVRTPVFASPHFQEFVVNFDQTGKTVSQINRRLLERKIHAGVDISSEFPELGQSALYCFSEVHCQADIDRLVADLTEVVK